MLGRRHGAHISGVERDYRLERLRLMAPWYGRALVTLAAAVPVGITTYLLQAFAGKNTDLNISVVASVSFAANLAMGYTVWRKDKAMQDQSAELNRLRGAVEAYETQSGTLGEPRQGGS